MITALQPQSVRTWGESDIFCIGGELLAVAVRRDAPKKEYLIRSISLDYSDIFELTNIRVLFRD